MGNITDGQLLAEHRRYPRKKMTIKVQYKDALPSINIQDQSASLNVSAGGLAIKSSREAQKEQLINLTLQLPSEASRHETGEQYGLNDDTVAVQVLARVAWVTRQGPADYTMGVHILDVNKEDRNALNHFLIDFQLDGPDFELYK